MLSHLLAWDVVDPVVVEGRTHSGQTDVFLDLAAAPGPRRRGRALRGH